MVELNIKFMHPHLPKTCCTVKFRQTAQIMPRIIFINDKKNCNKSFLCFPKYNFLCDKHGIDIIDFNFFQCVFFFRVFSDFFLFLAFKFLLFLKDIEDIKYTWA